MTLRSTTLAILFAAAAVLAPAPVLAQITTFVAPPRKAAAESTKAIAAAAAKSDSATRMSLGDMKAWVDSAAGVNTTQVAAADTAMIQATQPNAPVTSSRSGSTSFSNGAIAPNTASPLPFYAAAGVVLIVLGLGVVGLARRRA